MEQIKPGSTLPRGKKEGGLTVKLFKGHYTSLASSKHRDRFGLSMHMSLTPVAPTGSGGRRSWSRESRFTTDAASRADSLRGFVGHRTTSARRMPVRRADLRRHGQEHPRPSEGRHPLPIVVAGVKGIPSMHKAKHLSRCLPWPSGCLRCWRLRLLI
ncbi:MAG: hypothetical protein ACREYE_28350 [Gammaproteobacteria bacterium]